MLAVKVCPKCGSENVKADPSKLPQFHAPSYLCLDCGFSGNMFPEIDKSVQQSEDKKV